MSVMFNLYMPGASIASNYIMLCDDAVGNVGFLYEYLIKNKIVPKNWYSPEEITIGYGKNNGAYTIYRCKSKKEIMVLRPTKKFIKPKMKFSTWDDNFSSSEYFGSARVMRQEVAIPPPQDIPLIVMDADPRPLE